MLAFVLFISGAFTILPTHVTPVSSDIFAAVISLEMHAVRGVSHAQQAPRISLGTLGRMNYRVFPAELATNDWTLEKGVSSLPHETLSDYWQEDPESILAKKSGATLTLNYQAKDVYLILSGSGIVNVFTTDKSGKNYGPDASGGILRVNADRMYHLIHAEKSEKGSIFLQFSEGIRAYAFTFGS